MYGASIVYVVANRHSIDDSRSAGFKGVQVVKHEVGIRGRDGHARRSDGRAMRPGGDSLVGEEARRGRKGRDDNALKG